MECKVSDLVKRGHDQAVELKSSCGAVDVRDVAQLISDLATQLDVQLARSNALAAENAGLKSDQVRIFNSGYQRGHEATVEGYYVDIHQNDMTTYHEDIVAEILEEQTPATDAFLAEVRAQGRNEGINYAASRLAAAYNHGFIGKSMSEVADVVHMILDTKEELENSTLPAADGLSGEYAEAFLEDSAAQLRKGVQS